MDHIRLVNKPTDKGGKCKMKRKTEVHEIQFMFMSSSQSSSYQNLISHVRNEYWCCLHFISLQLGVIFHEKMVLW